MFAFTYSESVQIPLLMLEIRIVQTILRQRRIDLSRGSGVSAMRYLTVLLPEGLIPFPTPWPDPLDHKSLSQFSLVYARSQVDITKTASVPLRTDPFQ